MTASDNCEKRAVNYGRKTIRFSLLYTDRKTLEIAVHPDTSVVVKSPAGSDISQIERKLIKRARWILKQQAYFDQFIPGTPVRFYIHGETHLYLGRQYRLKLTEGPFDSVKLSRGFLHVTYKDIPTPDAVKKLLDKWYLQKARVQFKESLDHCRDKFTELDFEIPKLSVRRMKKRWGSLSKKSTMTLNSELIKAPKECIEYVIIHELCHIKYHDHSPAFFKLLESAIPDWEKRKHKLELSMVR